MDLVTKLLPNMNSRAKAYDSILVIMDQFTKMAYYLVVCKTIDAIQLADLFFNHIVKKHNTLQSIVSDRSSTFTS